VIFDGDVTKKRFNKVFKKGLQQSEPYWNFGFPILTSVLGDLERGLWFVVAPENVGKSQFQINLGHNVLKYNERGYWLDFALDDNAGNRIGYLLACTGDMPISLVKRAGDAPEDQKLLRFEAFNTFLKAYKSRYCLFSEDGDDDLTCNIFDASVVYDLIGKAREDIGPDAKLFVTIDGFHDLMLSSAGAEETVQQKHKSQILKKAANQHNALICCTAQTRKDSRKRNITADIMKGEDTPAFDAMVISHLYSDVNHDRDLADIWWEDAQFPGVKLPVHELDILKNKGGSEKRVIFYNHLPMKCWDYEVDNDYQQVYREMIFKKLKKK
jgi:hypothetical protein